MDPKIERSARYWDGQHGRQGGNGQLEAELLAAASEDVRYWLAVPSVRRHVNRRMTGREETLFISEFVGRLRGHPARRGLSVGCGSGELERGVVDDGAVLEIEGIDPSGVAIERARQLAAERGMGDRIRYQQGDVGAFLEQRLAAGQGYDIAFCHGVLHHIEDLEGVLAALADALRGGRPGLLYVDEYVGPSRSQWHEELLGFAAGLFDGVPVDCRRTPHVWPPIAIEDPTEMIRSSEIEAVLGQFFEVEERVPYYGNVLLPLVSAIRGSRLDRPEVQAVLDEALALEDHLAERRLIESMYAAFVARPRPN